MRPLRRKRSSGGWARRSPPQAGTVIPACPANGGGLHRQDGGTGGSPASLRNHRQTGIAPMYPRHDGGEYRRTAPVRLRWTSERTWGGTAVGLASRPLPAEFFLPAEDGKFFVALLLLFGSSFWRLRRCLDGLVPPSRPSASMAATLARHAAKARCA